MHTFHHQCIKTKTWYLAGNRLVRDCCCIGHQLVRVILKASWALASWWINVYVPAVALQAAKFQVLMPRRLGVFSWNFDQIVFKRLQRLKLTYFIVNASVFFLCRCLSTWAMKAGILFILVGEGTSNWNKYGDDLWIAKWGFWEI